MMVSNKLFAPISMFHAEQLMDVTEKFPKLHNLTTLLMGKCEMGLQFRILRVFLKNVPSLEKITLKHCKVHFSVKNNLLCSLGLACYLPLH